MTRVVAGPHGSRGFFAAQGRRALWRAVLALAGGLRTLGDLPPGPCVIVANHSSHADTAALLAALPGRRRPVAAAAADYWFRRRGRARFCRVLCAAFPVRRGGGGSADLAAAAAYLGAGHDVIVFPEGTRSRDGRLGPFHTGAARLARSAGVPLVPAWIDGTAALLPVSGMPRRSRVTVRFGSPLDPAGSEGASAQTDRARTTVGTLSHVAATSGVRPAIPDSKDSGVRVRVSSFAGARIGMLIVALWAFSESLSLPLLPEVFLAVLCVAAPRAGVRLSFIAAAASVAGGAVGYALAAHGLALPEPLTTARMHAAVRTQLLREGPRAVRHQPFSGIPFKVYAAQAGRDRVGFAAFMREAATARGARIVAAGVALTAFGAATHRWRRFYPWYLVCVGLVFTGGLAATVASWS